LGVGGRWVPFPVYGVNLGFLISHTMYKKGNSVFDQPFS